MYSLKNNHNNLYKINRHSLIKKINQIIIIIIKYKIIEWSFHQYRLKKYYYLTLII